MTKAYGSPHYLFVRHPPAQVGGYVSFDDYDVGCSPGGKLSETTGMDL